MASSGRCIRILTLLLGLLLTALHLPCAALVIIPTAQVRVQFAAHQSRLDAAGSRQVDAAIAWAASCEDPRIQISAFHANSTAGALLAARHSAIQARFREFGIEATVKSQVQAPDSGGRRLNSDELLLGISDNEDMYCIRGSGHLMKQWVAELAHAVSAPAPRAPRFWQLLSPEVRRKEVALPLARTALCGIPSTCEPQRAAFWWLVTEVAVREPVARRIEWQQLAWEAASDEDLARLQAVLKLKPLSAALKASRADYLSQSELPWPVIERRLLEPGVMAGLAEKPAMAGGDGLNWLLNAAWRRKELASFGRLLEAAGPGPRSCYLASAIDDAASQAEVFADIAPHLATWSKGATPLRGFQYGHCDVTSALLSRAACWPGFDEQDHPSFSRGRALWKILVSAGFEPDQTTVQQALDGNPWSACKLVRTNDADFPFRRVETTP